MALRARMGGTNGKSRGRSPTSNQMALRDGTTYEIPVGTRRSPTSNQMALRVFAVPSVELYERRSPTSNQMALRGHTSIKP